MQHVDYVAARLTMHDTHCNTLQHTANTATHCNTLQHAVHVCTRLVAVSCSVCRNRSNLDTCNVCCIFFLKFNAAQGAVGGEPHIRLTRRSLRCRDTVCHHSKSPPPRHFLRDSHRKDVYRKPHSTPAANLLCFESVKVN